MGSANNGWNGSVNKATTAVLTGNTATSFQEVEIIDNSGNLKKRQRFTSDTNNAIIDITALQTGTYIVRVFNGKSWEDYQIIITK